MRAVASSLATGFFFWQRDAAHCFRGEVGLSGIQEMDWKGGKGPGTETNPGRNDGPVNDVCFHGPSGRPCVCLGL